MINPSVLELPPTSLRFLARWAEETSNVTEISTTELSEGANTPSELSQLYLSSIFTTEVQTNTFEISTEISKAEISDTPEISTLAEFSDFSYSRKLLYSENFETQNFLQ